MCIRHQEFRIRRLESGLIVYFPARRGLKDFFGNYSPILHELLRSLEESLRILKELSLYFENSSFEDFQGRQIDNTKSCVSN